MMFSGYLIPQIALNPNGSCLLVTTYGSLKENAPPQRSGTIRKCGFVEVGMALWEEVYGL